MLDARPSVVLLSEDASLRTELMNAAQGHYRVVASGHADDSVALLVDAAHPRADDALLSEPFRGTSAVLLIGTPSQIEERNKRFAPHADDFLLRPFTASELKARIEGARIRRGPSPTSLRLEAVTIDLGDGTVTRDDGRPEHLTTKELQLLRYMARKPGIAVTRDELLAAVWGFKADALTRTTDNTIRRLRSKIEQDSGSPRHVLTEIGAGYRFVPLVEAPSGGLETVLLPPLPRPNGPLLGRAALLSEVEAEVRGSWLVTLHGMGGIGKSRLAQELALAWQDGGATAIHADLTSVRSGSEIVSALELALGQTRGTGASAERVSDKVGDALARKTRLLVVLDNGEDAADELMALLPSWHRIAPEVRFLVTSRRRLDLDGEVVLPVPPLDAAAAHALFVARFPDAREHADRWTPLLDVLEGVPLALELAAARARLLPHEEIERRLRESPTQDPGIERMLAWAWQQLSGRERTAFAWASVFQGGFTVLAMEAALGGDDVLELLETLERNALITIASEMGARRLRLLEVVRHFAGAQLDLMGARQEAEDAHAAWVLDHFRRSLARVRGPDSPRILRELRFEEANLLAAYERLSDRAPSLAAEAARILGNLLWQAGRLDRAEEIARHGAKLARDAGLPVLEAELDLQWVKARRRHGFVADAHDAVEALSERSAGFDTELRARIELECAGTRWDVRAEGATEQYQRAAELARGTGTEVEWQVERAIGMRALMTDDYREGVKHIEAALEIAERQGDWTGQAMTLQFLALNAQMAFDLDFAEDCARRAIDIVERLEDRANGLYLLNNMSRILAQHGRFEESRVYGARAYELNRALDARHSQVLHHVYAGEVDLEEGDFAGAARHAALAHQILARAPRPTYSAVSHLLEGRIALRTDRVDEAVEVLEQAVHEVPGDVGDEVRTRIQALVELAVARARAGREDVPLLDEARRPLPRLAHWPEEGWVVDLGEARVLAERSGKTKGHEKDPDRIEQLSAGARSPYRTARGTVVIPAECSLAVRFGLHELARRTDARG